MTALPAYPVSIVGRSSFMGLANITCGDYYTILGKIIAIIRCEQFHSSQCQSVYCKILKIQSFMDRFFSFLSRNKSVFSFKNRSRTGKTDDFSSPGSHVCIKDVTIYQCIMIVVALITDPEHTCQVSRF